MFEQHVKSSPPYHPLSFHHPTVLSILRIIFASNVTKFFLTFFNPRNFFIYGGTSRDTTIYASSKLTERRHNNSGRFPNVL